MDCVFVSGTSGTPQPWRKRAEYRSDFATSPQYARGFSQRVIFAG